MDKSYILGEGGFAIVMGPFLYKNINDSGLFGGRLKPTSKLFIVKAHKKGPRESQKQLKNKQTLYTKLIKNSRHNSIIFPLATSVLPGKIIIDDFPVMKEYLKNDDYYQVELEEYGGIDATSFIVSSKKPVFNMAQFLKIWRCVPDILEDSYHVLFDNYLIMTDIKSDNIVVSTDYVMRLIDVDINPNKNTSRITTDYIEDIPPQYYSRGWWHPHDQDQRLLRLQQYKFNKKVFLAKEKKMIRSIVDFIHGYKDPYSFVQQNKIVSQQDNRFQRLFFVMYPLMLMILKMIVYRCVEPKTANETAQIKKIISFCLETLKQRGRFNEKLTYKTFQNFIFQMKMVGT
jgi:hypothetical protein